MHRILQNLPNLINWVDFGDLVNVHQECGKQPIGNGKEELDALNKNLFVLFAWSV